MTRARPILTSFNAGEMSPLVGGRPDLEQYKAGLARCENFLPRVQGAATRRGGTSFVAEVKNSGQRSWLVPFEYAVNDAFVLEFGHNYIRFYRNRAVLEFEAPDWSASIAYAPGDYVTRLGAIYECLAGNTNDHPPGANWRLIDWDAETDYVPGKFVTHDETIYQCRKPHAGVEPGVAEQWGDKWHALAGTIYEIFSPYGVGDLTSQKDGSFRLRYVQSGDVINFAHPAYRPFKLTRYGNLDWRIEEFVTTGGPFRDQNEDKEVTVWASGVTGEITLTALGGEVFKAGHVGSKFQIQMKDGSGIKPWYVYKPTVQGDQVSSDGKYYACTQVAGGEFEHSAVTGTEKPIHTEGRYWDGDGVDLSDDGDRGPIGVEWEFLHAGYGWVLITGVDEAAQTAQATVLSRLPQEVVGASNATWRWAHAAWSDVEGWPDAVAYFRERLTFSKGRTIYASQAGDFANFKARDFGEVLASSAVILTIDGGSGDAIEWLAPADKLLAGVGGTVHAVGEASLAQAFGPSNTAVKDQVLPGANGVQPLLADEVLYVEKGGQTLNECAYAGEAGRYEASALTVLAEHLTRTGIVAMAWHKRPYAMAWCVNAAGGLVGLTYNKAQKVVGWSRMATDGNVESVAVVPSPDGRREELWLIVQRQRQNGPASENRRYVEVLNHEYADGDDLALLRYCDCSLEYDGAPVAEIDGLEHLEGRTVNVLADGAAHPQRTVVGGAIALQSPASKVVAGLPAPAYLKLMPIEAGSALGSAQGAVKRICKVILRLIDSVGGKIGPNDEVMDVIAFRERADAMDAPPPLFTGDKEVDFPGGYSGRASVAIACEQDLPFTLAAMMLDVTTHEG